MSSAEVNEPTVADWLNGRSDQEITELLVQAMTLLRDNGKAEKFLWLAEVIAQFIGDGTLEVPEELLGLPLKELVGEGLSNNLWTEVQTGKPDAGVASEAVVLAGGGDGSADQGAIYPPADAMAEEEVVGGAEVLESADWLTLEQVQREVVSCFPMMAGFSDKAFMQKVLEDYAEDLKRNNTSEDGALLHQAGESLMVRQVVVAALLQDLEIEIAVERHEAKKATQEEAVEVAAADIDVDDTVGLYFRQMGRGPLLTAQEEIELANRIETGRQAQTSLESELDLTEEVAELKGQVEAGQAARKKLAEANTRLVVSIAKGYMGQGLPFVDLIQEGNVGLMRAVDKFDPTQGNKFSTYATYWIRQAITRALGQKSRTVRISLHAYERIRLMYRLAQRLEQQLGRRPTTQEIADELVAWAEEQQSQGKLTNVNNSLLHFTSKQVEALMRQSMASISLEKPVGDDEGSVLADFIEDEVGLGPSDAAEQISLREELEEVLSELLTPRQERILRLRFGLDTGEALTLQEIAAKFGLSRERIRQLEKEALNILNNSRLASRLQPYLDQGRSLPEQVKEKIRGLPRRFKEARFPLWALVRLGPAELMFLFDLIESRPQAKTSWMSFEQFRRKLGATKAEVDDEWVRGLVSSSNGGLSDEQMEVLQTAYSWDEGVYRNDGQVIQMTGIDRNRVLYLRSRALKRLARYWLGQEYPDALIGGGSGSGPGTV